MPKNDKTFLDLYAHLSNLEFKYDWVEHTENNYINSILNISSKKKNGNVGYPDFLYVNEEKKLLILIELKTKINYQTNAIKETKHYLKCFNGEYISEFVSLTPEIQTSLDVLSKWNIIGLAISGNIREKFNSAIDTFTIKDNTIQNLEINELLKEENYLNLFKNINVEEISTSISESSKKINNLLYDVKEDKRPTLLSILMISLFNSKHIENYFSENFIHYDNQQIISEVPVAIKRILGKQGENIPEEKINALIAEFDLIKNEKVIQTSSVIKTILHELKESVIPLFELNTSYDIIGRFYQEFLRYAGIVDVQSGIVLTPEHITELFTELIDLKENDIIFDSCCGTGSFLIAGMNKLIDLKDTEEEKLNVKQNQIIGNELKNHMYILAISNMLFRGDGKSNILNYDFFSKSFDREIKKKQKEIGQITIGFINPPYSGSFIDNGELDVYRSSRKKSSNKKPWMKEIKFLEKMCNICNRYVVMIAPPQVLMSEADIREKILKKNTLKAVIKMPNTLFEPSASTGSQIMVFETKRKHNYKNDVIFYDLKDDGFQMTKRKGRRDVYNKWNDIKSKLLDSIDAPLYRNITYDGNIINTNIKKEDEWVYEQYSKINYLDLTKKDFENQLKTHIIFEKKRQLKLLTSDLNEYQYLDLLSDISTNPINDEKINLDLSSWIEKDFDEYFEVEHGTRLTKKDRMEGEIPLITAGKYDNGIKEYIESDKLKLYSNTFTWDMFGNSFFNNFDFMCDDNIYPLMFKGKELNVLESIFINTILQKATHEKFNYTRQLRKNRIINFKILLPMNGEEIDFDYINKFMKSLLYSSNIVI